jgi:hypothetical protein
METRTLSKSEESELEKPTTLPKSEEEKALEKPATLHKFLDPKENDGQFLFQKFSKSVTPCMRKYLAFRTLELILQETSTSSEHTEIRDKFIDAAVLDYPELGVAAKSSSQCSPCLKNELANAARKALIELLERRGV